MVADFDPNDKRTPLSVYQNRAEQRGNRPDLKPIPVCVTPLFFEEYYVQQISGEWKAVGVIPLSELPAGRKLGWEGKREFTLTENLTVQRCFREQAIKASPKKPVKVRAMVQAINQM